MSTEILRIEDDAGGRITADDDGDPSRSLIFDTRNDDPTAPGTVLLFEGGVRALVERLTAWLDAPRLAARESAEIVAGGWRDISTSGEQNVHQREIGEFTLACWDGGNGWAWAVEWGDNDIAEGETALTREDNETADAWASSLPRAKADCEAAARKAGIAVPAEATAP